MDAENLSETSVLTCGIVMPISAIDGCSAEHWVDVRKILSDSIEDAGFRPNLVSLADDVGIIQKRIIQNLYENPVVVCDVSGKNSNVMFELGMRLAFDKPTIIIKDDATNYSFDTAPIEHLNYPRDLRFNKIVEFKKELSAKIQATHKAATDDQNYTTFLKNFGEFKVAKLDTKEVPSEEFILEELKNLSSAVSRLAKKNSSISPLPGIHVSRTNEDALYIENLRRLLMDSSRRLHENPNDSSIIQDAKITAEQVIFRIKRLYTEKVLDDTTKNLSNHLLDEAHRLLSHIEDAH